MKYDVTVENVYSLSAIKLMFKITVYTHEPMCIKIRLKEELFIDEYIKV